MKLSRNAMLRPWRIQIPPMQTSSTPRRALTVFITTWNAVPIGLFSRRPAGPYANGAGEAIVPRVPRSTRQGEQLARRLLDIGLPHQALADEEAAHAGGRQPLTVGVAVDPAFADQKRARWRQRREALGRG